MIHWPLRDVLDEQACYEWLREHLQPHGLHCPQAPAARECQQCIMSKEERILCSSDVQPLYGVRRLAVSTFLNLNGKGSRVSASCLLEGG